LFPASWDKKSITRFILTLSRVFSYFLKGFDWDLTTFISADQQQYGEETVQIGIAK
jgi:hypothetical protein